MLFPEPLPIENHLDISSATNYIPSMKNESSAFSRDQQSVIARISCIRETANLLIERELQARELTGILPAHGTVFAFLFCQKVPVPIKSLIDGVGRVKSTVTGIVNTLEKHGYVFKQACVEDARCVHIGLTEKGWAVRSDFEEISQILMNQVYGHMPQRDRNHFIHLLSVIENNLKEKNTNPEPTP